MVHQEAAALARRSDRPVWSRRPAFRTRAATNTRRSSKPISGGSTPRRGCWPAREPERGRGGTTGCRSRRSTSLEERGEQARHREVLGDAEPAALAVSRF